MKELVDRMMEEHANIKASLEGYKQQNASLRRELDLERARTSMLQEQISSPDAPVTPSVVTELEKIHEAIASVRDIVVKMKPPFDTYESKVEDLELEIIELHRKVDDKDMELNKLHEIRQHLNRQLTDKDEIISASCKQREQQAKTIDEHREKINELRSLLNHAETALFTLYDCRKKAVPTSAIEAAEEFVQQRMDERFDVSEELAKLEELRHGLSD